VSRNVWVPLSLQNGGRHRDPWFYTPPTPKKTVRRNSTVSSWHPPAFDRQYSYLLLNCFIPLRCSLHICSMHICSMHNHVVRTRLFLSERKNCGIGQPLVRVFWVRILQWRHIGLKACWSATGSFFDSLKSVIAETLQTPHRNSHKTGKTSQ
jgi:hypothetical protein